MKEKSEICLVACSVLKEEIQRLIKQGKLDCNVVFVSKNFHIDYALLEKNLRKTIERALPRTTEKPVLVYGDLCLGPNGEMNKLASEYGLVKVDAQNCVDCLLGGKGAIEKVDPNHELMFFDPGMIEFFQDAKKKMQKQGIPDEAIRNMFSGIKGIVLLDTLGNAEECKLEIEKLQTGLVILETKQVGLSNLSCLLLETINQCQKKR